MTSDLKGYFFGIARNRWKEHLRARKETIAIDENMAYESIQEESADPFFERIVTRAFEKLKPEYQEVLTLFSNGHSYEEMVKKLKQLETRQDKINKAVLELQSKISEYERDKR